jgi:hypothetical protein
LQESETEKPYYFDMFCSKSFSAWIFSKTFQAG